VKRSHGRALGLFRSGDARTGRFREGQSIHGDGRLVHRMKPCSPS
jgi:hypothetical protein